MNGDERWKNKGGHTAHIRGNGVKLNLLPSWLFFFLHLVPSLEAKAHFLVMTHRELHVAVNVIGPLWRGCAWVVGLR